MLIFTRKNLESVVCTLPGGEPIVVTVLKEGSRTKLGITAPDCVAVHRAGEGWPIPEHLAKLLEAEWNVLYGRPITYTPAAAGNRDGAQQDRHVGPCGTDHAPAARPGEV